jgi:hypothetical protein
MEKAAILTGRVTGPGGAAKAGAMVTLTSLTKSGPGRPELKMTDSEGRYRFDSLDPGEYRVNAQGLGEGGVMRIESGGSKGIAVTLQGGVETTKDIQLDK